MYILITTGHVWESKDLDRLYATNSIIHGTLITHVFLYSHAHVVYT